MASFGNLVFQILGFVQLTLVLFFSLLFTAGNIAQEKDRQTLILLLMTDLSNHEIVLGKLLSSLLQVGTLILASVPVFIFLRMLGGVGTDQVLWLIALCVVTAMLSGSWAAMVALWREKTFQTLSTSVLGVVVFLGLLESLIAISPPDSAAADWLAVFSPYRALIGIISPLADESAIGVGAVSALDSIVALGLLAAIISGVSIQRLRVWNPSRSVFIQPETTTADSADGETRRVVRHRRIWSNPVIWREIRTRAYGRRMIVIKLAYLAMAAFVFQQSIIGGSDGELVLGMLSRPAFAFVGLSILGLMLINAQAVTCITNERDGKTLDLLVATDITAKEFVYGKLGGVFYNTAELALIPLAIVGWFAFQAVASVEDCVYLAIGFLTLVAFAAMLGLHSGLGRESSRQAIASSMGTIFFLFVGIFILLILLVETRGSFANQIQAFLLFILAGGLGLVQLLTHHNPSPALRLAGGLLPLITFYAITTFLLQGTLGVCLSIAVAYGFTTLAMLIPAVSEFDVALGRSTVDQG
jgi:ABC-type transport system involved in multi-copper enzyme maturation permease subunit